MKILLVKGLLSQAIGGRSSPGKPRSCLGASGWDRANQPATRNSPAFLTKWLVGGITELGCGHMHTDTWKAASDGPRLLPRTITALSPAPPLSSDKKHVSQVGKEPLTLRPCAALVTCRETWASQPVPPHPGSIQRTTPVPTDTPSQGQATQGFPCFLLVSVGPFEAKHSGWLC